MTTPELAVVTDGLTKRFADLVAVDRVDLRIESGTVFSLLGPNGAGKTTMVRMLATLSAPTSGTAVVCGHDVVREADAVRRAGGHPPRAGDLAADGAAARLRQGGGRPPGRLAHRPLRHRRVPRQADQGSVRRAAAPRRAGRQPGRPGAAAG